MHIIELSQKFCIFVEINRQNAVGCCFIYCTTPFSVCILFDGNNVFFDILLIFKHINIRLILQKR